MPYTTRTERDGRTTIITPAGNVARMTDCEPFITADTELATESLAYLNQTVAPGAKQKGTNRMKSMWGVVCLAPRQPKPLDKPGRNMPQADERT